MKEESIATSVESEKGPKATYKVRVLQMVEGKDRVNSLLDMMFDLSTKLEQQKTELAEKSAKIEKATLALEREQAKNSKAKESLLSKIHGLESSINGLEAVIDAFKQYADTVDIREFFTSDGTIRGEIKRFLPEKALKGERHWIRYLLDYYVQNRKKKAEAAKVDIPLLHARKGTPQNNCVCVVCEILKARDKALTEKTRFENEARTLNLELDKLKSKLEKKGKRGKDKKNKDTGSAAS